MENEVNLGSRDTRWVLVGDGGGPAEARTGRDLEHVLNRLDCTTRYPVRQTAGIVNRTQDLNEVVEKGESVMLTRLDGFQGSQTAFETYR